MTKILPVIGVLLLLFWLWRRWSHGQRRGFIQNYNYQARLDQRLLARRPGLTEQQRQWVFEALQDYFLICLRANRKLVAMPSQAVDDAWHEFILFTRYYQQYCRRAFGFFLHHTPNEVMPSRNHASAALKRTWHLACQLEGINPKHPERLPRLFALDALLGLSDGFHFTLDCRNNLRNSQGNDAYCASDLGCGGDGGGAGDDGGNGDSGDGGGDGCGGGGCGGGD